MVYNVGKTIVIFFEKLYWYIILLHGFLRVKVLHFFRNLILVNILKFKLWRYIAHSFFNIQNAWMFRKPFNRCPYWITATCFRNMVIIYCNISNLSTTVLKKSLKIFTSLESSVTISAFSTRVIFSLDFILFENKGETFFQIFLLS